MNEQNRKIAELAMVLQQHKSQWEERWRPLSSAVASAQQELQRQAQSIRPFLKSYHTGLAAFSRYRENYLKQVEKALAPLGVVKQFETLQLERIVYPVREISRSIEQISRAVAYPVAEISQSIERVRRTLEPFEVTVDRLRYAFPTFDLAERWRSIHIAVFSPSTRLVEECRERLRLLPFYLAWKALQEGDRETVDYFLAEWCDMPNPSPEAYTALWNVLRQGHWRRAENPADYVKTALWRQIKKRLFSDNKLLVEEPNGYGFEAISFDNLLEGEGRLWVPAAKDDIEDVENRLLIEQLLRHLRNPADRKAILAYSLGYAETLREAYGGDKNRQDAARRRVRKLAEQLKPLLFN